MQNLWYKNAIAYSLDVETFMDSNGDEIGMGDDLSLEGRTSVRTVM